ncbi:hypothetical protein M436DRAFT_67763 [Aureobasidium namibiae CBS 147.97]|uniref:Uncharacterized protein n=1 Tax=Aureobasidium namibiae CBS 147.97 TaxID=1043004 RepID=A0A074W6U1_9PEZI
MCLCGPFSFTFKRKARKSDLDDDSIYVNYESSSTESSISSSSSSSSSLGYLDPYDFASLDTPQLTMSPTSSTCAARGGSDSAMNVNDNFSTATESFSDLIAFSSDPSQSSQQSEHFVPDAISTCFVYSNTNSILAADSGYNASLDTDAITSQITPASAVHGPVNEGSLVRTQRDRAAELRVVLLAILRGGCANEHNETAQPRTLQELRACSQSPSSTAMNLNSMEAICDNSAKVSNTGGTNKPSCCVSSIYPACDSPNTVPKSSHGAADRSLDQITRANKLCEPHGCCIGVLSTFEEAHLGHEEKQAIIEGGYVTPKAQDKLYQQPRQPLPLVQRPPHRTTTRSGSGVVQPDPSRTNAMLNSRDIGSKVVSFDLSPKGLDFPQSKLSDKCSIREINSGHGLREGSSDSVIKHKYQRKVEMDGWRRNTTISKFRKRSKLSEFDNNNHQHSHHVQAHLLGPRLPALRALWDHVGDLRGRRYLRFSLYELVTDIGCRAQLEKVLPALPERKKDCPLGNSMPAVPPRVNFDDLVAKHGHKGRIPMGPGVSLVLRRAPTGSIRLGVKPSRKEVVDFASCSPVEHKLVRKKGYANLREQMRR